MSRKLEAVLSIILTACAVVVATIFAYQQMVPSEVVHIGRPTQTEDWEDLLEGGLRIGSSEAPLQIIEFGDFECPFCKMFHESVTELMADYPNDISLVYYHYPLSIHRFADQAARAAHCASDQYRFAEMAERLFAMQDSFGLKPWRSYAEEAGVPRLGEFDECLQDRATAQRIRDDRALGDDLSIRGTPTVMINGWLLPAAPSIDSLEHMIERVSSGEKLVFQNQSSKTYLAPS